MPSPSCRRSQARQGGEAAVAVVDDVGVGVAGAVRGVDDAVARRGAAAVGPGDVDEAADEGDVEEHGDEGRERTAREAAEGE